MPMSTGEIYGSDYFSGARAGFGYVSYDEDKEPMVPAFKKYLRYAERVLGGKGRLLDVGAATGFFVRLANGAGFQAEGVEISAHAAQEARNRGIAVKTGTLADVQGVFDVITMLDVIEHVPDPRAELKHASDLLRTGGALVINTPDAGSFVARLMGKKWHAIVPPEHLYYFNRSNLSRLLAECGFDVVENTTIGKSFTLKYIFKTLRKMSGLWLFGFLSRMFSWGILARLSLPVNLRDNMFIVARKV